ncbi:MAG: hypothetical protein JWM73_2382 [Solirubrobacterales bacterium]|nr:hypothetical protein [Solirubrobacterales bacterium]
MVRAAQELTRAGSPQVDAARELREASADLIAETVGSSFSDPHELRGASLMIVDIISQYVLMESAGWIPERDPAAVGAELERLIKRGLYR